MNNLHNLHQECDNTVQSGRVFTHRKAFTLLLYALLFYGGVKYALPVILPFLFGLSTAALVQKPAALLSSRIPCLSRKVCCVTLTAVLLLTAAMLLAAVTCSAVNGAISFCPDLPARLTRAREFMVRASERTDGGDALGRFLHFLAMGAQWCVDFFAENYRQYLPSFLRRSTAWISRLPSLFAAVLFGVAASLFACGSFEEIRAAVRRLLPAEIAGTVSFLLHTSVHTLTLLLKAYGTLMLITFGELTLGFAALRLLGFDTGPILANALLIALIDILPVLGTGTVLIPWGLFELLTGSPTLGLLLLGLFAIIGTVRNFLEPKFIAERLRIHPFFTLAGVYIGGKLFGAAGIIVMPLALMILRDARQGIPSKPQPQTT